VVARCQGHSSFVSGLAFDEIRCDGRTYRFGSVGEDNKFILVRNRFTSTPYDLSCTSVGLFEWVPPPAESLFLFACFFPSCG